MGVTLTSKHSCDYDMGYGSFFRFRNMIAEYVPSKPTQGTINFLEQSDCGGKLSAKECKNLLSDINGLEDDSYYGYIGRGTEHCMTLNKFRELLENCISHRCNLVWY